MFVVADEDEAFGETQRAEQGWNGKLAGFVDDGDIELELELGGVFFCAAGP